MERLAASTSVMPAARSSCGRRPWKVWNSAPSVRGPRAKRTGCAGCRAGESAPADLGRLALVDWAGRLRGMEVVATAVGVERRSRRLQKVKLRAPTRPRRLGSRSRPEMGPEAFDAKGRERLLSCSAKRSRVRHACDGDRRFGLCGIGRRAATSQRWLRRPRFVRRTSDLRNLGGLDVHIVYGDLRDPTTFDLALRDCD